MDEITHYESIIIWKDGNPVVDYRQMLSKEVVAELPLVALSRQYERSEKEIFLNIDEDLEGKTNAEVMNIRMARCAARGDREAFKLLQDRILGKPKQQIESTKLSMTYTEYLEQVTKTENEIQEIDI